MGPDEIPQDVVDAYTEAWEAKRKEIGDCVDAFGTKTRAGLSAAINTLEQLRVERDISDGEEEIDRSTQPQTSPENYGDFYWDEDTHLRVYQMQASTYLPTGIHLWDAFDPRQKIPKEIPD